MAKRILIVSNLPSPECQLLRNICARLRTLVPNKVDGYYGDAITRLSRGDELDSLDINFVMLGLSPSSHEVDTPEFIAEQRILKRVLKDQIPLGIICDRSHRITAPHLHGGILELVRVVGATRVEPTRIPSEIYPNARVAVHPAHDFHVEIADHVAALIQPRSPLGREIVPSRQMAASQPSGWHNTQLTD
jgi:hypothetical protein